MNFIKKLKKGFTIVELVIVIAVLAILAAVLVPTFANVVEKANQSADTQLVRNLNTILIEEESSGSKPTSVGEVLALEEENGYNVANLQAKAKDYHLVWNPNTNRFYKAKVDGSNVSYETYPGLSDPTEQTYEMWTIASEPSTIFSTYLYNAKKQDFTVSTGLDVGEEYVKSVTYIRTGEGTRNVSFITKGNVCTLTVYAPNDHVEHYGYAAKANVVSVNSTASYHEYGAVNELVVTSGKIVIENTGVVFTISAQNYAKNDTLGIPAVSKAENSTNNYTVANNGNVMANDSSNSADITDGTITLTTNVFNINNLAQLEAFRDATNSGATFDGITVNLNCDINLTSPWVPISNYYRKDVKEENQTIESSKYWFKGTFDGKGHTINGLTNEGLTKAQLNTGYTATTPANAKEYIYGFFASVNGAKIKNVKFTNVKIVDLNIPGMVGDCVAACVGFYNVNATSNITSIEGVTVSGSIAGYDDVGGIVGMVRNTLNTKDTTSHFYFTMKDCEANVTMYAVRRSAGLIAQLGSGITDAALTNCKAAGTASSNGSQDQDPAYNDKKTALAPNYYLCGGLATLVIASNQNSTVTAKLVVTGCSSTMKTSTQLIDTTDKMKFGTEIQTKENDFLTYQTGSTQDGRFTTNGTYTKATSGYTTTDGGTIASAQA